jgi:LacI family transcriptional regulator, repressor for deo operon, udp, cdd, tsx, nupC, and nupG
MAEFGAERIPLRRARLSDQVREILADRILGGDLPPNSQLPPEPALAEAFGVSIPVIREAVGVLVRANVLDRRQGRGTFVRHDACDWLREPGRLQGTLAVVASWTHGYYFHPVYEQLTLAARGAGWMLQFVCPIGIEGIDLAQQVLASGAQGIVWLEGYPPEDAAAFESIRAARPIVLFNFDPAGSGVASVRNDDGLGAAMAIGHLIGQGHQRICFATNAVDAYPHAARLAATRATLTDAGIPESALRVLCLEGFSPTLAERRRFRRLLGECSAAFFSSAFLFQHLAGEVARASARGPRQLAFATYDDFPDLVSWDPPVTAIRQPIARMAEAAIAMLDDLVHGLPVKPTDQVFAPELVVRKSTTGAQYCAEQADPEEC